MEKLNLHDTLRIYLPGLFLCAIVYWFYKGSLDNIQTVAFPAIFVSLLLDQFFKLLDRKYYNLYLYKKKFSVAGRTATIQKILEEIACINLENRNREYVEKLRSINDIKERHSIIVGVYTRSHSNDTLSVFRSHRSYGVLCFNAAIVCFVMACITCYFICNDRNSLQENICEAGFIIPAVIFISCLLFLYGSDAYYKSGLMLEINFWMQLSSAEIEIIKKQIDTREKLSTRL